MKKYLQTSIYMLAIYISCISISMANSYPDFTEIAEIYADSVVNISTKQNIENRDPFNGIDPEEIPDVFREYYEKNKSPQQQKKVSSLGSGFVIDKEGIIVTNAHVIKDADGKPVIQAATDTSTLMVGAAAGERLIGGGGDDQIAGVGGDDVLIGGAGDDFLDGGVTNLLEELWGLRGE